jgi:hypothetical protein
MLNHIGRQAIDECIVIRFTLSKKISSKPNRLWTGEPVRMNEIPGLSYPFGSFIPFLINLAAISSEIIK